MASVFLEGEAVEVGNIFCIGRNYAAHIEELKNEIPWARVKILWDVSQDMVEGWTLRQGISNAV